MLLTVEKVLILKSVSIFAGTPEQALVEAALVLNEVHLEPEQELFAKGDTGTCLYIIVEGKVRVHDGPRVIAVLGAGEVVGELAAIDPEPRMAAVTAAEASMLLRMEHLRLHELIAQYPEVGLSILRVLCRRLRNK
jgi:CRP/FNR family transcriptional regulator, cyclic AMP receptor protein